jgi:hypothetical protein
LGPLAYGEELRAQETLPFSLLRYILIINSRTLTLFLYTYLLELNLLNLSKSSMGQVLEHMSCCAGGANSFANYDLGIFYR